MTEKITALLIHENPDTLRSLKYALECQGLRVTQAESHAQAKPMLGGLNPAPSCLPIQNSGTELGLIFWRLPRGRRVRSMWSL